MYDLTKNDLEDILKIVNFCMARIKTGNVEPKDLLIEMLKTFRSYDAEFFPSNQSLNGVDLANSLSIKEDKANLVKYANYYWRYDPLYSAQFSLIPVNRVFKTDDVISHSQLKKLAYYREYLRHINWLDELVIRLCTDNGFWGTMSISRSSQQPYFNQADVQKAEFLLPYLINTFEATMFFSKINGERQAFEQWLESRPEGIILLDAKSRPIFFNKKAEQMCSLMSNQKLELPPKHEGAEMTLPLDVIEECKHLINSRDDKSSFSHNRIINAKNGERFYIKYTLINQSCRDITTPYFIIHINDLSKNNNELDAGLLKDCGLSEREEKVAQYVSLGLTNKEIGEKIGISQFTVQSHLRNIFDKTGIERRTQLATLIK
jgi:DNA-binding CsgD family transcriptional regulator